LKLEEKTLLYYKGAKLTGSDSISVPFKVTVPSKSSGKSTESFGFVLEATDTIGNMSSKTSNETFSFYGIPDLSYYDASGTLVESGSVQTINASSENQLVLAVDALDVGGVSTIEWVTAGNSNVTFTAKDESGNDVTGQYAAGGTTHAYLNLYALIPVETAGVDPFAVKAVVYDIDANPNEEAIVTYNINQPPIFAAAFPFEATEPSNAKTTGSIDEVIGVGYNTAYGDVREVTIEEGLDVSLTVTATDANAADVVTLSATGTAITAPNIKEGFATYSAGQMGFSFKPGYLAVTGEAKSATFELDINASDGTSILPDTVCLIFNVLAKSATPEVTVVSVKIDGNAKENPNTLSVVEVPEGSSVEICYMGQDPGNEALTPILEAVPSVVPEVTEVSSVSDSTVVYGTLTFTAGLQDADVPELSFDGPYDPFIANFSVANASFSASRLVPVDIINVSQAPVVSASATVDSGAAVAVVDGGVINVEAGSEVAVSFYAVDPDGDAVLTNLTPVVTAASTFTVNYSQVSYSVSSLVSLLEVGIPAEVLPEDATVTVVYTAEDSKGDSRTFTFTIVVGEVVVPVTTNIDQLVVAQGFGGDTTINFKNIDEDVSKINWTDADGNAVERAVDVNSTYRSMLVASVSTPLFVSKIGGGLGRSVYVDSGDIDGDGDVDLVMSMGAVTEENATYPNIVMAKDARTKQLIANSFVAFQSGTGTAQYSGGDTPIAVGNFTGASMDQIATSQGFGGNNIIRIYQYTGLEAPYGFEVVGQFNGLPDTAQSENANKGVTLAAGDVTGDGIDELIVCQTNSDTSKTKFVVIGLTSTGTVSYRKAGVAFSAKYQGNGGVVAAVANLNDDATKEIIFASSGNSQDFPDLTSGADPRNSAVLNVLSVQSVIVNTSGAVQGFYRPSGSVRNVLSEDINPSGAQSVEVLEANGEDDGDDLAVGTGSILEIDGTTITPVKAAPEARYSLVKLDMADNGSQVTGVSQVIGQAAEGFQVFKESTTTSGAINMTANRFDEDTE